MEQFNLQLPIGREWLFDTANRREYLKTHGSTKGTAWSGPALRADNSDDSLGGYLSKGRFDYGGFSPISRRIEVADEGYQYAGNTEQDSYEEGDEIYPFIVRLSNKRFLYGWTAGEGMYSALYREVVAGDETAAWDAAKSVANEQAELAFEDTCKFQEHEYMITQIGDTCPSCKTPIPETKKDGSWTTLSDFCPECEAIYRDLLSETCTFTLTVNVAKNEFGGLNTERDLHNLLENIAEHYRSDMEIGDEGRITRYLTNQERVHWKIERS